MTLIEKATAIIIGLIFVLIVGQIVVSVNPSLNDAFSNNVIFAVTGPLTLILLALLAFRMIMTERTL